ncbi:MAG: DUF302 domain-containing protein [Chthoniobacter sp.]|nr:DUF302 domain-containing protein [Chthoniobacter sp.]
MKFPALLLLFMAFHMNTFAQKENTSPPAVTTHPVTIQHVSVASRRDFSTTVHEFEQQLGTFDPKAVQALGEPAPPVEAIRSKLEAMAGPSGFMRFGNIQTLGHLLPLVGRPAGKANQYLVGNPLFAVQMTQYNPAAGLYAPLRVLIYEDASGITRLEYDLPSSLFGQWDDPRITQVALMLDQKLEKLAKSAAGF